jgi:hypothetical protein
MINLTYGQVRNQEFLDACQILFQAKLPYKSAKRVAGIFKEVRRVLEEQRWKFDALSKEHMVDKGDGTFELKEGEEHKKAFDEFLETKVEINYSKVTLKELTHVQMTAADVEVLEGLIESE